MSHDRHKNSCRRTISKRNAQSNGQENRKSKDPKNDFRLASKFTEATNNHFPQWTALIHPLAWLAGEEIHNGDGSLHRACKMKPKPVEDQGSKVAPSKTAIDLQFSNLCF